MGKIFGISDNPVSIPTSPFEPVTIPEPKYVEAPNFNKFTQPADQFVHSSKGKTKNINRVTKFLNHLVKSAVK